MMNDETVILENQTDDASTPNDFVETAPATPTDSPTPEEEETNTAYNLLGQKISHTSKYQGIIISNGKKILHKK